MSYKLINLSFLERHSFDFFFFEQHNLSEVSVSIGCAIGWSLFLKVKNIEVPLFHVVPLDEKKIDKNISPFEEF